MRPAVCANTLTKHSILRMRKNALTASRLRGPASLVDSPLLPVYTLTIIIHLLEGFMQKIDIPASLDPETDTLSLGGPEVRWAEIRVETQGEQVSIKGPQAIGRLMRARLGKSTRLHLLTDQLMTSGWTVMPNPTLSLIYVVVPDDRAETFLGLSIPSDCKLTGVYPGTIIVDTNHPGYKFILDTICKQELGNFKV